MKLQRGQSAVVTGASSGLGEQFARQLAERGLDLILVARSGDKLEALAAALRTDHGVGVTVLPADLNDPAAVSRVIEAVFGPAARPVDLLVNNAGLGHVAAFVDETDEQVARMVDVNVTAVVRLTRAAAAAMTGRGQGAILNIASTAAFQPVPKMAVYAATKAFLLSFGQAVDSECRVRGVQVTTFCPGPTVTGFAAVAGASPRMFRNAPTADVIAAKGLHAVERGRRLAIANLREAIMANATRVLPRGLVLAAAKHFVH